MKKLIILFIISYLVQSCISLKFPDKMEINISVPEDYNIEKLEILVDTLKSQAKDKFDMQVEIGTVKKSKQKKKNRRPKKHQKKLENLFGRPKKFLDAQKLF